MSSWNEKRERMKELLDQEYSWPAIYPFKFIVPKHKEQEVRDLFPASHPVSTRPSSGGKYISLTISICLGSSDEVLDIYAEAYKIEGIICL